VENIQVSRTPPARPLDVVLLFDVEDIFSPQEVGNDDSIKELATILTEEGLRGTFLFIGDRALHLQERGRFDVIESVAAHHEVGLHSRSARHPCGPEYVADKSWEEGLAETLKQEREGAEIIRNVFGQAACALSTHYAYATPHAQRAAALLGLPYVYAYPAAPPLYNLSWYTGALGLPWASPTLNHAPFRAYFGGFDDCYPSTVAFEGHLQRLDAHIETCLAEGQPFLSLFLYHPQRLRLLDFIDRFWSPNGINYPPELWGQYGQPRRYSPVQVARALVNFRRLVRWIRADPRLRSVTVTEVARRYGAQPASISRAELAAAAEAICAAQAILLHERFSPAEMLVGLAQALVHFAEQKELPAEVPRQDVLGPTRNPIWHPEAQGYAWEMLIQRAQEVMAHVEATGHLPATLGPALQRVGINNLCRAFAEAFRALHAGTVLPEVPLRPMPRYPEIAQAIGLRYLEVAEGHLADPDLDIDALYRHGKLQTWTLKPAVMS